MTAAQQAFVNGFVRKSQLAYSCNECGAPTTCSQMGEYCGCGGTFVTVFKTAYDRRMAELSAAKARNKGSKS